MVRYIKLMITFLTASCFQSMDNVTVCAALQTQYMLVNTDTTHVQELFPFEATQTRPFTIRIAKVGTQGNSDTAYT